MNRKNSRKTITNKWMKMKTKKGSEMIRKIKMTFHNLPMTKIKSSTNWSKKKDESSRKSTKSSKEILNAKKSSKNISEMLISNFSTLKVSSIKKTSKLKLKITCGKSPKDNVVDFKAKLRNTIKSLHKTNKDSMIFKSEFSEPMRKLNKLSLNLTGTKKNWSNGQLLESKSKKTMWFYKSTENKMMPKSESWISKSKNWLLKFRENNQI